MMDLLFKGIGALGILLISLGLLKNEKRFAPLLYLFGGICLEVYSLYIWDEVFIILQALFTITAAYKVWSVYKK